MADKEDNLEKLIKAAYKKWKLGHNTLDGQHPDEETLACFLENRLTSQEKEDIKAHLVSCDSCVEIVAIQMQLYVDSQKEVPDEIIARVKNIVEVDDKSFLEILLKIKDNFLEILNTTGDVLVGQELVPAPILRSREIKGFKDEVLILKDFKEARVEVRIENKQDKTFSLTVNVKEKLTQKVIKDLRVTLSQGDIELESYHSDSGKAVFEHVSLGKYKIEIFNLDNKLASVLLDIKI
jgi:DNA-directed RNA polymerase beta' subunit